MFLLRDGAKVLTYLVPTLCVGTRVLDALRPAACRAKLKQETTRRGCEPFAPFALEIGSMVASGVQPPPTSLSRSRGRGAHEPSNLRNPHPLFRRLSLVSTRISAYPAIAAAAARTFPWWIRLCVIAYSVATIRHFARPRTGIRQNPRFRHNAFTHSAVWARSL